MQRTILDIHVLQTVPPSNLNRDDTGSPKSAVYGGVRRARVSSQAWKRATRKAFEKTLDTRDLGVRTKRVVELLAERITTLRSDLAEQADELATETLKAAGITVKAPKKKAKDGDADARAESGYLLFLSTRQVENLADAAIKAASSGDKLTAALKALDVKHLANRDHSVDVALFGRMVADVAEINVDAAAQVAHAISVHAVENEYDYFTAVDDRKEDVEEAGAGMIGTVEFNSATLYRFATVDINRLFENLGSAAATSKAAAAFVQAFVTSMPTGKQNTFANRTLPDVVVIRLRETQPVSFAGAFEEAVPSKHTGGRVRGATEKLASYADSVETAYAEPALASWVVRVGDQTIDAAKLGEETTLDSLVATVGRTVDERLAESS